MLLLFLGMGSQAYAMTDSCHCVAFRFDDIQDYYLNDVQIEVINTFEKKNSSLTIGIIGNYFGNDQKIVNFVKEKVQQGNTKIEVANHGWNHEDFTKFSKYEQSSLIQKTNDKVLNILGVVPLGFVTPFNVINNDTLVVLQEKDMMYVSANVTTDEPPHNFKDDMLYHLPSGAFTGNLNNDDTEWLGSTHKETYAQILGNLVNYGFSVVTLHPQEYSIRDALNYANKVDLNQIRELELLIDELKNNGIKIITIKEIPENVNVTQKVPKWVKQIFVWYENKKISEIEVINAINFLTQKGIVQFNA